MDRLLEGAQVIQQGAEARVYKVSLHANAAPILLKHRFAKQYRHPTLDASLTKARVAGEARALMKCLKSGVRVPGIRMVDVENGCLGLEWVEGMSVRKVLGSGEEGEELEEVGVGRVSVGEFGIGLEMLMVLIGESIAQMHLFDIIHGDLTTSNMMLRRVSKPQPGSPPAEIVLIDFGLSFMSTLVEDKAVDLYVLERAFASTHPDSEPMFAKVLDAYAKRSGKAWEGVKRRLEDVRLRGRKRSMVG
ncbi:hypothetical protein BOTBODRAFT_105788 [Botryobasidium botryosum FD-172 SS1]|uniref:EKC/KEOPS complex subunit BUD32 n=1 Tax=Botryobasidium botryosum (strain FD-172 SS1) TaxID=930990 RepID=A0A067MNT3_BOTB1|nr:hypothetical protein BOTBODRAFT_105788 [Botryobasidium botryosum FD-172 SS1]